LLLGLPASIIARLRRKYKGFFVFPQKQQSGDCPRSRRFAVLPILIS
jgi:hypothetical protein